MEFRQFTSECVAPAETTPNCVLILSDDPNTATWESLAIYILNTLLSVPST